MSRRYIEQDGERWEVRLGRHAPHPGRATVIFYPSNNQRPYRVVEIDAGRFDSQDQLDALGDDGLHALFRDADIMDYVHQEDAGAHHATSPAKRMPPEVGTDER